MAFQTGYKVVLTARLLPGALEMEVDREPAIQKGRVYLKSGSQEEWIAFNGVQDMKLTGLERELDTKSNPTHSDGQGFTWIAGTAVRIVAMHDQMTDRQELLSGENTWTGENVWEGDTTLGGEVKMQGDVYVKEGGKLIAEGTSHPAPTVADEEARDALYTNPVAGDLVFVTSLNALQIYNEGTAQWESFGISTPTPEASESVTGTVRLATSDDVKNSEGDGVVTASKSPVVYSQFAFKRVTGSNIVLDGNVLCYELTPDNTFTISAGSNLRPGTEYVLRVHTQTPYIVSLGTGVTNPYNDEILLKTNKDTTMVFFATSNSTLELWAIRTAS